MAERIYPAPELKHVHFPKYADAIRTLMAQGYYDPQTGWRPKSVSRIRELIAELPGTHRAVILTMAQPSLLRTASRVGR